MQQLTPFELLGGAGVVRHLTDRFYDIMDSDPTVKPLRDMHPADLTESRDKLYMFLSGWLGGPNLYMEKHGHPRLRMRHMPFAINEQGRDQWMYCMKKALDELICEDELKQGLFKAFFDTADFMRNQ